MTHMCRSAGLTGFADLARTLGLDPLRLAAEAKVPVSALNDPDLKIPSDAVGRMLEAAARRSGTQDFGLRLAEKRKLSNMGAVALIAREQPTLRRALEVMAHYQWMQNDALSLRTEESSDIAVARLSIAGGGRRPSRQAVELSIAVLCRNICSMLGKRWRPEAVYFRHEALAKLETYRRVLGVVPMFGQEFDGIVLPRAQLAAPVAAADPDMARQVELYIEQLAARRSKSARDEAGEMIVLLMPTGQCSAGQVARRLGVDRRTLHRRLTAEGITFSDLLDEKRRELALSLMADPSRNLGVIAEQLGFSAASAYSHWFRQHFDTSPRTHRKRRREAN